LTEIGVPASFVCPSQIVDDPISFGQQRPQHRSQSFRLHEHTTLLETDKSTPKILACAYAIFVCLDVGLGSARARSEMTGEDIGDGTLHKPTSMQSRAPASAFLAPTESRRMATARSPTAPSDPGRSHVSASANAGGGGGVAACRRSATTRTPAACSLERV
jgi:hypothetical protein